VLSHVSVLFVPPPLPPPVPVDGGDAGADVGGKVAVIVGAVGVAILGIFTKSFLTQGYYFRYYYDTLKKNPIICWWSNLCSA
jgi:hypothetical protein